MGIGDWEFGIGNLGFGIGSQELAQSPIPNSQSLIPNPPIPQSPIPNPQSQKGENTMSDYKLDKRAKYAKTHEWVRMDEDGLVEPAMVVLHFERLVLNEFALLNSFTNQV